MFRRKPKAVVIVKPELTAEEKARNAAAELECWRYSNPVKTFVVTFKDGSTRDVVCYYYENHDDVWTHFRAWVHEGSSGRWDSRVTVFKCRSSSIETITLKSPIPEALRAYV